MRILLLTLLIAALLLPATAGAVVDYTVDKPTGYSSSTKYPVIYVMPEDGYTRDASGLTSKLFEAMGDSLGANMLVVRPTFTAGMDLYAEMAALVADVDAEYSTIADPAYRAIVGTGTGGYLAYQLALINSSGSVVSAPDLFTCVGSVDGNFVDNPWYGTYGDVYTKLAAANSSVFDQFYTYMDAPVESEWINDKNSSNDLGQLFIGFGTASSAHEYTARLGAMNSEFMAESADRMIDRFSSRMISSLATGSVSLKDATLPESMSSAEADYSITVSDALANYATGSVSLKAIVSVIDPVTGEVLATASKTHSVSAGQTCTGSVNVANKVNDLISTVKLSVILLNDESDLATTNLIRYKAPTNECIELMGDWYFNYTGTSKSFDCTKLTKAEFETWSTVVPALGNWADGYGNIVDPGWYGSFFSYMITGNGYYARTFTVPSGFDAEAPVLSIGYVDDRCEVFLNGTCVGRTGMDDTGNPNGETAWAVYSCFEIDPSLLNIGGENTVVVRAWNDTPYGAGGWYNGPVALYSGDAFAGVGGDSARFYEETFYSDALGAENDYLIYLPEDYFETDCYYPTMYLLHQFNSDHTSYRADKINELMDEAARKGLIDDMIVVIPNSSENSWWKGQWESMVVDDLIPHIEENYRSIPDARYRMTAGCSMGGQGAFSVALCNPDVFTGTAGFFGAFDYGDYMGRISPVTLAKNEGAEYMDYFTMAFICGNQDDYGFGNGKIELNQVLDGFGVEHYFFIENGGHNSAFYVPYFQDTISYLRENMFTNTTKSAPLYDITVNTIADDSGAAQRIEITVTADEKIKDYFLQIPDSSYSGGYVPGITVPFIVNIDLGETKARSGNQMEYAFNATFSEESLTWTETIDLSATGADAEDVEVTKMRTQFLGRDSYDGNGKLENLYFDGLEAPELPATGDDSNLMLAVAMFAVSAAVMTVLLRRKCRA